MRRHAIGHELACRRGPPRGDDDEAGQADRIGEPLEEFGAVVVRRAIGIKLRFREHEIFRDVAAKIVAKQFGRADETTAVVAQIDDDVGYVVCAKIGEYGFELRVRRADECAEFQVADIRQAGSLNPERLRHGIDRDDVLGDRNGELRDAVGLAHREINRRSIEDGADTFRGLDVGNAAAVQGDDSLPARKPAKVRGTAAENACQPGVVRGYQAIAEPETLEPALTEKRLVSRRRADETEAVDRPTRTVVRAERDEKRQQILGSCVISQSDVVRKLVVPEIPRVHGVQDECFLVGDAAGERPIVSNKAAVRASAQHEDGQKQKEFTHHVFLTARFGPASVDGVSGRKPASVLPLSVRSRDAKVQGRVPPMAAIRSRTPVYPIAANATDSHR